MKKFNYLNMTVTAIANLIMGVVNMLLTICYLALPMGLFLLIMQLRSKNNKASALGAFTDTDSEFQFIFPYYILIANKPRLLKETFKNRMNSFNKFLDKWRWVLLILILVFITTILLIPVS